MKFTIDLEDLVKDFIEEANYGEYGIEEQFELKKEIRKSITQQVCYNNFQTEIKEMRAHAYTMLKSLIEEKIGDVIEKQVVRIIRNDKFKYNWDKEELTLADYIKKIYEDTSYNRKLKLEDIAKSIANEKAEEMKERYDILFASQFVSKLDELGLLKDEAAKILLEKK